MKKSSLEDLLVPQEVRCWQSDSVILKLLETATSPRYRNCWHPHLEVSEFQGGWLSVPSPALIFPLKIFLPAFFDPCVIHADVCASSNVYLYSIRKEQNLNSPSYAKEKMGEQDRASLEVSASHVLLEKVAEMLKHRCCLTAEKMHPVYLIGYPLQLLWQLEMLV